MALLVVAFAASACRGGALLPPELDAAPTQTAAAVTPVAAGTLPAAAATLGVDEPQPGRTLRIWLAPGLSHEPQLPGGPVLGELIDDFGGLHSDVAIDVQVKNIQGDGGTLSYLKSGRSVAPDVLPDLIILPSDLLATVAADGLIIPLSGLVQTEGLYPAAVELGQIDGTLYGYSFAFTDLHHFVYNANALTDGFPARWNDLVALTRARLTFAAAGRDAGVLALHFYTDFDGVLSDIRPRFVFQQPSLVQALTRLEPAALGAFLTPGTLTISSPDDAWSRFLSGQANVVLVEANRQLQRRAEGNRSEFAAIPGRDERSMPIVRGWAWAITTPEPARQALAAEAIAWLAEPNNMGRWSSSARMLPTRPVAFTAWESDTYTTFLQTQLQNARAYPNTLDAAAFNTVNNAAISVLTGINSAAAATQSVLDAQQP